MLPDTNKSDMAGTVEANEECLRSHHGVGRVPLAYVIRKTIIVQTYGNYPKYKTPDDNMITTMLHLPPDKKLLFEHNAHSVKEHTAECMRCIESSIKFWIRSVKILICIHLLNNKSPSGVTKGRFIPIILDGWAKSCQCDSTRSQVSAAKIYILWRKESMEL